MKILILNTWYYPNMQGGAEFSVKILAETLANKGHIVGVFCIDSINGFESSIVNSVHVFRSSGNKYNLYRAYFEKRSITEKLYDKYHEIWNISIKKDLNYVLESFKPDIIHCNCMSGISLTAFKLIHKKNIPVVLTLRNYFYLWPFEKEPNDKHLLFILKKIYILFCRYYTKEIQAVTAPSQFVLNKYSKNKLFLHSNIKECIPNCIIPIDKNEMVDIFDSKKNRKDKTVHFLYAGWLTEPKGIRVLIKAFLKLEDENVDLTICGAGNLENEVIEATKKDVRIKYLGKLSQKELYIQYKKADVLIVPSLWEEPFGRVIIEGNEYGLPVIASNRGGIPEIIKHTKGGILYDGDNIDELIIAIKKMSKRETISQYFYSILENIDYYSNSYQADMFIDLYNRTLSS